MSTITPITPWQARTALAWARAHYHGWAQLRDTEDDDLVDWLCAGQFDRIRDAVKLESPDWPGITPLVVIDEHGHQRITHTTGTGRVSWVIHADVAEVYVHRHGVEPWAMQVVVEADPDVEPEWALAKGARVCLRHLRALDFVGPAPAHLVAEAESNEAAEAWDWLGTARGIIARAYQGDGPAWREVIRVFAEEVTLLSAHRLGPPPEPPPDLDDLAGVARLEERELDGLLVDGDAGAA